MIPDCWIVYRPNPFKVLGYFESQTLAVVGLSVFQKYENHVCIVHAGMLCRLYNDSEIEERPF